jgi:hypothetical protein
LEQLHYRRRDYALIVFAVGLVLISIVLSMFSFGKFWIPPAWIGLLQ